MSGITKALIIEDNDEVIDAISLAFKIRWPQVVTILTGRGEEGIELENREQPDVVILDLGLPDMSSFEVLKQIRFSSTVPVIILTVRGEEADIVKGLELGADEYIVKPFKQLELMSRVKAVTRRQSAFEEDNPIVCGQFYLNPSERTIICGERQLRLTRTENILLSQLMRNAGRVVTHTMLAEGLWGNDYPDAAASLKVHIQRLRRKIEPDPNHPRFIMTSYGLGYLFAKLN